MGEGAALAVDGNLRGSGGKSEGITERVAGIVVGKDPLLTCELLGAVDDLRAGGGLRGDHARDIGT